MGLCKNCGDLPDGMFYIDERTKSGLKPYCKKCYGEEQRNRKKRKREMELAKKNQPVAKKSKVEVETDKERAIENKKMEQENQKHLDFFSQFGSDSGQVMQIGMRTESAKYAHIPVIINYPEFKFEDHFVKGVHSTNVVIGSSKSGKTTFMSWIYPKFDQVYDLKLCFCNNIQAEAYNWMNAEEKSLCFETHRPDVQQDLNKVQKLTQNYFDILNYYDDCSSLVGNKNENYLIQAFLTDRNKRKTIFFSTQSPYMINKNARANCSRAFLFACFIPELEEVVINTFLFRVVNVPPEIEAVGTKDDKIDYLTRWFRKATADHHYICLDYLNRKIFRGKVPI